MTKDKDDKDEMFFHADSKEQDPSIPNLDHCPDHPNAIPEMGYGMAGGGMGPYSFCPECGKMLSKSQDEENE